MTKSELKFMDCERFGVLSYHNVYSFYYTPIAFTALNEFGQIFFCYSLGMDDVFENEMWLISPISEELLNKLEQKEIAILNAMQQSSKSKTLFVKVNLNTGEKFEAIESVNKLPYILPESDVLISENINYDGRRKHTHRIRFFKNNKTPINSGILDGASKAFNDFCKNFLNKFEINNNFFHQDAINGSFVYRVKSDNIAELQDRGHEILSRIASEVDFINALDNKEIDLRIARNLFEALLENDLNVQLYDEQTTDLIFSLDHDYVARLLVAVDERIGRYLDSTMVPQADNLERIKRFLELTSNNQVVTSDSLDVHPRQVNYYRDACQLLSLVHSYGKITPIGFKALNAENDEVFLSIIQRQFEETECGYIWMREQNVNSVLNIDEETAVDFLINNCNGLSDNTSRRRAQTLKSWVKKFKASVKVQ
ncbi:DUF6575 domain-containing protein [Shewanella baltica]|uniref:DUF6575 domain-containing protein n=1 Tax=Shewanella baltica TaxID=62322 RepID=UPI003D7AC1F6